MSSPCRIWYLCWNLTYAALWPGPFCAGRLLPAANREADPIKRQPIGCIGRAVLLNGDSERAVRVVLQPVRRAELKERPCCVFEFRTNFHPDPILLCRSRLALGLIESASLAVLI